MKFSEPIISVDLTITDIDHIRGALILKIEDCITEWRNRNMEFVDLVMEISGLSETLDKLINYPATSESK